MKTLALLLLALLAALPTEAGEMRALRVRTDKGDVLRSYYLNVPASAKSGAPLVIMLHGAGSSGQDDAVRLGWRRKADLEGFILTGPDATPVFAGRPVDAFANPRVWNDGASFHTQSTRASDDSAFLAALIDEMARLHRIDRRRVYLAGFSSGGNMAARFAQEMSERIAAVMIAAGQFTEAKLRPTRGVPLLYFSGDADPLNPVRGAEVRTPWGTMMPKEPHRTLVERWGQQNSCPQPLLAQPDSAASARVEIVGPCRDGSEVRYVLVRGLAHDWPVDERGKLDGTLSATNEAWNFFRRFRLPAEP